MKTTSAIYASLSLASFFTLSTAGASSGSIAAQHRNLRLARSEPIPARRAMGRRSLGQRTDHLGEAPVAGAESAAAAGSHASSMAEVATTSAAVVQQNVVTSINSKGQTVIMTYPADAPAASATHLATSEAAAPAGEAPAGKHYVTSVNSQGQTITMTMDGPAPVATPKTKEAPDLCKTGSAETDLLVLNFANTLEKLETQFYIQGLAKFSQSDMVKTGLSAEQAQIIVETLSVIAGDENEHSIALEATIKALGSTPFNGCSFDFSAALSSPAVFLATARALELVGVSAYAGGAALITSRSLLTAATSIHSIEARHQTTLNILNAGSVIPSAFDMALAPPAVLALAGGFLSGCSAADFGLTAGNPLSVRNAWTKSTKFAPGDQLSFTSVIEADENTVFCAMLVGGASQTVTLPLHQCTIPDHVDGPVYVWITSDSTPLAADINIRDGSSILAGPGLFFVEGSTSLLQNAFTFTDKTAGKAAEYQNKGKKAMAGADLGYAGVCKMGDLNKSGTWYEKPENQMQIEQTVGIGCKVLGFKTVGKDALPK